MKIKHFTIIDDHKPQIINWDFLRDNPLQPSYFIPFSKEEYIDSVTNFIDQNKIENIIKYCYEKKINRIISVGSGRCILEYGLKLNSNIEIIVTDTSNSINRIKSYNIFDDALQIDYLKSEIKNINENDLILLSRVDTEFDDEHFKKLFERFSKNGVTNICFIPAELLNLKIILAEAKILLKSFFQNKKMIFCGFARSKNDFYKVWGKHYNVLSENLKTQLFFLIKK